MENHYGTRYLEVDQFIRYCERLNVKTDKRELEYYEKSGIMLPIMRVTYPEDYVRLRALWFTGHVQAGEPPRMNQWEGLAKIFDKDRVLPKDYADTTDEELIDSFDREIGKSPFLTRPSVDTYKPWKEYEVQIEYSDGLKTSSKISETYYGYWQIYQLKNTQNYPDLWKNKTLFELIPPEKKQQIFRPWAPDSERLCSFNGLAKMFDILSFWITIYNRTELKAFSNIPEKHQIQRLDDSHRQAYLNQIIDNAKSVQAKYSVTIDELYAFLYELINLRSDYLKDEKFKLAGELRNDIIYLSYFIQALTGNEWSDVAEELSKRNYPFWIKKHFQHLDVLLKEQDEAADLLKSITNNYNKTMNDLGIPNAVWEFPLNEIEQFLNYCRNEGLSLFITSASGMIASQEEYAKKFRRVSQYTNIKNIVTSLEYLLRDFITKGNLTISGSGLNSAIKSVMEHRTHWFLLFDAKKNLAKGSSSTEFYAKLINLMNDPELSISEESHWAQIFLIASLARNLTVHEHPGDDWFYGELFGELLGSTIYAMLYSWKLAKKENWI